jgi:hypothetical protein
MPLQNDLKHIFLPTSQAGIRFIPVTGFDPNAGERPPLTARQNRFLHANKLNTEVETAIQQRVQMIERLRVEDPETDVTSGISLDIKGAEHIELDVDALENRQGAPIEILNVRIEDGQTSATIFIPERRLDFFKKKINKYGDATNDPDGTKGATISVDSIEAIKLADLNSFWMDEVNLPSNTAQPFTWEIWVRKGMHSKLLANAIKYNITVSKHKLTFQECEICLITASQDILAIVQIALAPLVGFSFREDAAGFFIDLSPREQTDWANDLVNRLQIAPIDAPAVCILDTGIYLRHPLLSSSLSESDRDAYDPTWGKDDHTGHGTQLAGVALYEDVAKHLGHSNPIQLKHRLESVKILPPIGSNQEDTYGWITQESVSRAITNAPHRKRVFCLAITSTGQNISGRPTAWSASLDKISMGLDDELNIDDNKKQLFVVSVGNIRDNLSVSEYPSRNKIEPVENPAQSWNALSVGGVTNKVFSEDQRVDGWELLAQPGDLSPRSRTSVIWTEKDWPIKPDIVFESGNYIHDGNFVSDDPDLSILTTGHDVPFKCTRDTSAATAAVARMAAILHSEYPELWPETVRGLIVHSAEWTTPMLQGGVSLRTVASKDALLRTFGYGIPNIDVAQFSAMSRACLISQQSIKPFLREENQQQAGYFEMNLHKLPWPQDYLREYGTTKIKLRVTLSYFIEPSPSRRIPLQQYSYASHQLRFDLQRPLEHPDIFKQRINKKERTPGQTFEATDTSTNWVLGPKARNRGSIISDVWTGTAGQLADQGLLAVMPEGGWWKARKHLNRANQKTRYALIITLESENQELDIYSKIQTEIENISVVSVPTST